MALLDGPLLVFMVALFANIFTVRPALFTGTGNMGREDEKVPRPTSVG